MQTPTALVGRAAEVATVRRLVDAAAGGSGSALLMVGEAGIGKTRLLDEAARRAADAGMVVLTGRAVQGGGTYRAVAEAVIGTLDRPGLAGSEELRPYRSALGRLLPGWAGADAAPPAVDPVVLLGEGLLRLLRAAGPACLLRLEDLHWADEDTIALVEHLAGAVTGGPVLLAVSARGEGAAASRLERVPGVTTVRPRRLVRPEVAALAAACRDGRPVTDAEVDRLLARSEGLPFLVEELLDTVDGVPPTLAGLVSSRLGALAPDERQVLVAAAVLGGELDWRLLAPTADVPEPVVVRALRAAVDASLLAPDLRWPHALTREAVLATLLPPERSVLARRGAEALARRAGPDDRPRAAELFVDAGERDAAAELLLTLARDDARRGALRSAEQLLARAAATGARAPEVAVERVGVLTLVGRVDEALDLGEQALRTLDGDRHAELCLRLARAAVAFGRWTVVEEYVERAGRPDDPQSLVLRADAAFGAGRADEAGVLAVAAIERAEQVGAHAVLCEALGVETRARRLGDEPARAAFRRAAQVAAEHGLTPWRVEALAQLGMVETLESADTGSLQRARELALDAGMLPHLVSIDIVLCDHAILVEGPHAAEPFGRRALETAAPLRMPVLTALAEGSLGSCRGIAGDTAEMDALLDAACSRANGDADVLAWASAWRAVVALLDFDLPRATDLSDDAMRRLLDHEAAPPLHHFGLWALLHTAGGDDEPYARISAHPAGQRSANRAALAYADALVAGREGRAGEAAARFADAETLMNGHHWWRRLVRLVALDGAVTDGWGDPVPELRADLEVHERDDAPRLARTCRDLLRRAGQPTRRGRGGSRVPPELRARGVTSREVDVLHLVAQGLTNAQVAERLFVSPRTVDTHVASLLAKTGAAGRGELGRWAQQQTR